MSCAVLDTWGIFVIRIDNDPYLLGVYILTARADTISKQKFYYVRR